MSTSIPSTSNPLSPSTPTTPLPQLPPKAYYTDASPRLFLPLHVRFNILNIFAFGTGFTLGAAVGHRRTSLRFRAENAHRLPTTKTGWYFYHKSKNYQMLKGGLKEGVKSGVRLMAWGSLFVVVEAGIDGLRRYTDALSTMTAGGVTGMAFGIVSMCFLLPVSSFIFFSILFFPINRFWYVWITIGD